MISLPTGWHWGIGSTAGGSKTYWFYTNLRFQYRGQLYTDPNQPWTVVFYEELGLRDDGDIEVSDYPCSANQFNSRQEAEQWLTDKAEQLHSL